MATNMCQVTPSTEDERFEAYTAMLIDLLDKMEDMIITPDYIVVRVTILTIISPLYEDFETIISGETLPVSLKDSLTERYDQHLQKITLLVIDNCLPVEIKDSLFYIERTLAEPSLYSLNGLIMWKETAEQKIVGIQNWLKPKLPKPIESVIVKRYESLRLRLKAEILIASLHLMEGMIAPDDVKVNCKLIAKLSLLYKDFETAKSCETLPVSLKSSFTERYDQHLQKVTLLAIDDCLPIHYKDSLFYIERTLAEPSLYSLNGLIMWKETAEQKIKKIPNLIPKLPKPIKSVIIKRYESLRLRLKAEILKMRTYPIPEPWCSRCMREEMTHVIEGEFIFYVDPEIEEDMEPVNPSKRDLLPGGITRQEYDMRLNRLKREYAIARNVLKTRNASRIGEKCKEMEDWYAGAEEIVTFTFNELSFLYRDARSLEYLVRKNKDDKDLREIYDLILREIRHYYDNRIDIPSFAIDTVNYPMKVAPPKEERNIPIASGVDRGGVICDQLDTPAGVIVIKNNVIVADRYGDTVSLYRANDLAARCSYHSPHLADTPVSLTYFKPSVFVCYSSLLAQYSLTWEDSTDISHMDGEHTISIPQGCCTASNSEHLYVGTLKPSLIHMQLNPLRVEQEYPLNPILHTKIPNRYPWLQEMRAAEDGVVCLFTGSPSPLQMFSPRGELKRSILTEDQIVGAYNFNMFFNPITDKWRIYICDFWDNSIKVFDWKGRFIETFCETGHGLCQIFRPSCIFIEKSGYITVGDMKVDNCLQRL